MKRVRGFRTRGAAIIIALVVALLAAMLITAAVVSAGVTRNYAKTSGFSEQALLLAEAGVNAELLKVSNAMQAYNGSTSWDTPTSKGAGSISGEIGSYSVWTSADAAGANAWSGSGSFYVTSVATVGGSSKTVTISANASSIFGTYGIFCNNSTGNGNSSAFKLTGNADIYVYSGYPSTVGGVVGTNGRISSNSNMVLAFGEGFNYGPNANLTDNNNTINSTAPIYSYATTRTLPTVDACARGTSSLSATVGMTQANTYTWLSSNLPATEKANIYTWSGTSKTLSASSSTLAYTSTPGVKMDATLWTNAKYLNKDPNTNLSCIILAPGDYYFNAISLTDATKELIIDNAGLTIGGNPNKNQVRLWIYGSKNGTDTIGTPITLTNPSDSTTFRVYYGTTGGTLTFNATTTIAGALYATDGAGGSAVDYSGGTVVLLGAIIADEISSKNGNMKVYYNNPANLADPVGGVGYSGSYTEANASP